MPRKRAGRLDPDWWPWGRDRGGRPGRDWWPWVALAAALRHNHGWSIRQTCEYVAQWVPRPWYPTKDIPKPGGKDYLKTAANQLRVKLRAFYRLGNVEEVLARGRPSIFPRPRPPADIWEQIAAYYEDHGPEATAIEFRLEHPSSDNPS